MKFSNLVTKSSSLAVAPFAGAWIEIYLEDAAEFEDTVAPFAGAWIEMSQVMIECFIGEVAPFAGAWIEIYYEIYQLL